MREKGAYMGLGFGFDLNGFASYPRPRFGERANCSAPQIDEGVTYPFKSFAGDITFEPPVVGTRSLDFNTEGLREKPERFVTGIRPEPWPGRPDIRVNVPQPIEEYNAWRWGPDWRIPKLNSELTERDLQCIRPLPNP